MNEEWEKLRALLLKFRKDQFKATADRGSFHREAEQFRRDLAVALQVRSGARRRRAFCSDCGVGHTLDRRRGIFVLLLTVSVVFSVLSRAGA